MYCKELLGRAAVGWLFRKGQTLLFPFLETLSLLVIIRGIISILNIHGKKHFFKYMEFPLPVWDSPTLFHYFIFVLKMVIGLLV